MDFLQSQYQGKRVLVTGHTGFKGSWLSTWLHSLGAEVVGLSNALPSDPCNFEISHMGNFVDDRRVDVRDAQAVREVIEQTQPDFVFHLAAQALVRPSYETPLETLATNAMGSANILDALRTLIKPVVAVMITSDKAYDNVEWVWGYRETDRLGGKDPYSASKGMAELAIRSYVDSYFNTPESHVRVGITRAGNVIGGGDWARDRIVPDCMKAWARGETVDIRSPWATRPWQHVLEPLSGYLALGAELQQRDDKHGEAYNFGPPAHQNHPVRELIDEMEKYWENVRWNDVSQAQEHLHEAGLLKLNCDKALFDLQWLPTLQFEETVRMTVEWYKAYYQDQNASMYEFTIEQINEYTELARQRDGVDKGMTSHVEGVMLTPLKIIDTLGGDVLHGLKQNDPGYAGFGEAYFSSVEAGTVKGWKRHRRMTLNLVVPVGAVRFVVYDDRPESPTCGVFQCVTLSTNNYQRLTVPPMVWMAFQGMEEGGMLLNIASIEHDPEEADRKAIEEIAFSW